MRISQLGQRLCQIGEHFAAPRADDQTATVLDLRDNVTGGGSVTSDPSRMEVNMAMTKADYCA